MTAYTKAGIALALLLIGLAAGWWMGSDHVQGKWNADKALVADAEKAAVLKRTEENAILATKQAATNTAITKAYDAKIADLNSRYATARKSSGLRIAASACAGLATSANPQGASRTDEASTIGLPEPIATSLYDIAQDADATSEQLTKLQDWIRQNGMAP